MLGDETGRAEYGEEEGVEEEEDPIELKTEGQSGCVVGLGEMGGGSRHGGGVRCSVVRKERDCFWRRGLCEAEV